MVAVSSPVLLNFVIFLGTIFFCAYLAKKLKLSPITSYIVSGLILGNLLQGIYTKEVINNFAYFGIILLLFTLGLEINFSHLLALKKFIIVGGSLQIIFSIFLITILSLLFHFSLLVSFLIGVALSSSSTTLVAKIIQDKGEEGSFLGEIALGILMFQDIAFIPFLIIFTSLTGASITLGQLATTIIVDIVKATAIISLMVYFGRKLIPLIFNQVTKTSKEVLDLFIIFFIFLITYLSTFFQIPIFIGVFVAGILVGQTLEYRHVFSEIRPVRDILAIIFFVFIGFNLNFSAVISFLPSLVLFTFLVCLIKALIVLLVFLYLKFHTKIAFSLSSYLFQIDEDAFILISQAYFARVISAGDYSFVMGAMALTLIATPFLVKRKDFIYVKLRQLTKKFLPFLENFIKYRLDQDSSPLDVLDMKNHVVICGYGRVGRYIGRALMLANIPFIAIDYNYSVVEKAKKEGVNIIYGDPTDFDILDYVQTDEARALISVIPGRYAQETIVLNAKKLNPKILIFNRVHQEGEQARMKDLGVDVVIQPEFEASLSIIRRILLWQGIDKEEIARKIKRLKIEHGMV